MTPKQFAFLKKAMNRAASYAKNGATQHVGQVSTAARKAFRPKPNALKSFAKRAGKDVLNFIEQNPKKTYGTAAAIGGGAIAAQQNVHVDASFDKKHLSVGALQHRIDGKRVSRFGVTLTKTLHKPKQERQTMFHLSAGRRIEPVKRKG